jgi:hypothetical protein
MLKEVLRDTKLQSTLAFRGFGAAALAESESLSSILHVAMQIRATKPCVAFREWLTEMDGHLRSGDLRGLSRGLRDIRGVIEDVRHELGLGKALEAPKLTLGFSPNVSLSTAGAARFLRKLKPRAYHVVFLRQHLDRMVAQSELTDKLGRLLADAGSEGKAPGI